MKSHKVASIDHIYQNVDETEKPIVLNLSEANEDQNSLQIKTQSNDKISFQQKFIKNFDLKYKIDLLKLKKQQNGFLELANSAKSENFQDNDQLYKNQDQKKMSRAQFFLKQKNSTFSNSEKNNLDQQQEFLMCYNQFENIDSNKFFVIKNQQIYKQAQIFVTKNSFAIYKENKKILFSDFNIDQITQCQEVESDVEDIQLIFAAARPYNKNDCILGFSNGEIKNLTFSQNKQSWELLTIQGKSQKDQKFYKMELQLDKYLILYNEDQQTIEILKLTQFIGNNDQEAQSDSDSSHSDCSDENLTTYQTFFEYKFKSKIQNIQMIQSKEQKKKKNQSQIVGEMIDEEGRTSIFNFIKDDEKWDQNVQNVTQFDKYQKKISKKFLLTENNIFVLTKDQNGIKNIELKNQSKDTNKIDSLNIHSDTILDFEFSKLNDSLITLGSDQKIKICRNFSEIDKRVEEETDTQYYYYQMALSQDEDMIAMAGRSQISIWSIKNNLITICKLPISSSLIVQSLRFQESDNILYAADKDTNFVVWKVSDSVSKIKNVIDKMEFAIADDDGHLVTYHKKNRNKAKGKIILWAENKKSQNGIKKSINPSEVFQSHVEVQEFLTEAENQIISYDKHFFFYKYKDNMIRSIAKGKKDRENLKTFEKFEGEISDIKSHGFHLFVMYDCNSIFKITVFDTKIDDKTSQAQKLIEFQINYEQIQIDKLYSIEKKKDKKIDQNFFDFPQNNQIKILPKFGLNENGNIITVQNGSVNTQVYVLNFKINDYFYLGNLFGQNKDFDFLSQIFQKQKQQIKEIKNFQIRNNGQKISLLNENKFYLLNQTNMNSSVFDIIDQNINQVFNLKQEIKKNAQSIEEKNSIQILRKHLFSYLQNLLELKNYQQKFQISVQDEIKKIFEKLEPYKLQIKDNQECNIFYINKNDVDFIINIGKQWLKLEYNHKKKAKSLRKFQKGNFKLIKNNIGDIKWFINEQRKVLSIEDFLNPKKWDFKKKKHISGSLNNLVPAVIHEMKINFKMAKEYIDFLQDNEMIDYQINVFNYVAYNDMIDIAGECLKSNIKFQRDYFGNTPLTYFLTNKSPEGVVKILDDFCEKGKFDDIQDLTQDEILALIELSPQNFDQFLNFSLQLQGLKDFEKQEYGILINNMFWFKNSIYFEKKKICKLKSLKGKYYETNDEKFQENNPLQLHVLNFKYNFTPGTMESKQFHQALASSEDKIFKNNTIQQIINYKWIKVYKFAVLEFLIAIAYIIVFQIYTFSIGNYILERILILFFILFCEKYVVDLYVFIKNVYDGVKNDKNKLKKSIINLLTLNFWDIMDIVFLGLFLAYIVIELGQKDQIQHQKYLLSFLNFFSWLKLVSTSRIFEQIRMFLHMIVDVIIHLKDFYMFFIFVILLFTTSFTLLMMDNGFDDQRNFINYVFILYECIFGNSQPALMPQYPNRIQPVNFKQAQPITFPLADDNTYYLFAFHLLAQFIISLIMMNLIIGLIGEALGKSMSNKELSKYKVANNMIMYCERFWPSISKKKTHLHVLSYEQKKGEEGDKEWKARITATLKETQAAQIDSQDKIKEILLKLNSDVNK